MSSLEKVLEFRSRRLPISTYWRVGEHKAYGSLIWEQDTPNLQITFEAELDEEGREAVPDHPILRLTKPPLQPNIVGLSSPFGLVTLENCARYNVEKSSGALSNTVLYELTFQPARIWIGAELAEVRNDVSYSIAYDTRLAGFFGPPTLVKRYSRGEENQEMFSAFETASEIWAIHPSEAPVIKLGDTGFALRVSGTTTQSWSSTGGDTLRSITTVVTKPPEATTLEDCFQTLSKVEQILSIFSLESFSFQAPAFYTDDHQAIALVWALGKERDLFNPPMRHQILVDLADPENLQRICDAWFRATPIVELSRWLFCRAIAESDSGLSRFITVVQALEVLGREHGPTGGNTKADLKRAAKGIRKALSEEEFDESFIQRTVGLVQSSNKASFRDVLKHMVEPTIGRLGPDYSSEFVGEFCKTVAETRNAVVHMSDNNKGALTAAFDRVNKLSLFISFWYAMIQAELLDVPTPNAAGFLFNNRTARHGLPNEILERQ